MDQHVLGAWIGELKSDAVIVAIVVVAVIGYVAATGRSPAMKKRSNRNKLVPFRKIIRAEGRGIRSPATNSKVYLIMHGSFCQRAAVVLHCKN